MIDAPGVSKRRGQRPSLSIVIAAPDAAGDVAPCLDALAGQQRPGVEVLVADGTEDSGAEAIQREFPWVRLVRGGHGRGLAELRAVGLAQSRGEIVAFTDVCCRVAADWVERLEAEPWETYAAVGGVVAPGRRTRPAAWAAFLCEYAPHLPAGPAGEASQLPGNNVGFRRDALERAGLFGAPEFWKVFALWRLKALGKRFRVDPTLVVQHVRWPGAAEFAYQRYLHGRCFAARRVTAGRWSWPMRLARAASCPVLPLLFSAWMVRDVYGQRRYRRALWQSLPFAALFFAARAGGELDGYLRGAGHACARLT